MSLLLTMRDRTRRSLWRQAADRVPVQTNYTSSMACRLAAQFGCAKSELPGRMHNHLLRVDVTHKPPLSVDDQFRLVGRRLGHRN